MNEILFKAKGQTTGRWFEGLVTQLDENVCYIKDKMREEWVCDPVTICRYTGLTDKNDKKIWGNDICIINTASIDEEDGYFIVKWDNDSARFVLDGEGLVVDFDNCYGYECEVIGNVFDDFELLNGDE